MDVQLQELIDKIKKDGVESAEEASAAIIADAEQKAAEIVAAAQKKADDMVENAKAETKRMEKASVEAVSQAGRNLLISFRDGINSELSSILVHEITTAYNEDMLKTLIPEIVKEWIKKEGVEDVTILLPQDDVKKFESAFIDKLNREISKGIEIKVDDTMSAGFKIGTKDGSAYYDFSAESVAELFSTYLNPKVAEIMKDAAKGLK
ncbi:MAG: V-type ATP synthase subunit E [Treponema sp. CETP13]|nr:MAG: V-type ATP synthase subunit E [Treponema sp. CETP13]